MKVAMMNVTLPRYMTEATNLTRQGRLSEAVALLRRGLAGTHPAEQPAAPDTGPHPDHPRIIDIDPASGEVLEARPARSAPPPSAAFLGGSYASDAGRRDYKLYVPSTHRGQAASLLVMLHGCTQSPDDFAMGTRMNALAEEYGCLVVYPGQTQAANAQKCWNWFSPADQQRDRGEPALIAGITRQVAREHGVDANRIYVAGLSAGGAAAAIMGMAYPDIYAAVGVHSGLACGAARNVASAFSAMRNGAPLSSATGHGAGKDRPGLPTIVFHADNDRTVHPRNGDQVIEQFGATANLRKEVQGGQVPGGRRYERTIYRDPAGKPHLEHWLVAGGGHAWSGGSVEGSYTDPLGPDASRAMLQFFAEHSLASGTGSE